MVFPKVFIFDVFSSNMPKAKKQPITLRGLAIKGGTLASPKEVLVEKMGSKQLPSVTGIGDLVGTGKTGKTAAFGRSRQLQLSSGDLLSLGPY